MHFLLLPLIVVALVVAVIGVVPSLRHYVLVKLGVRIDIGHAVGVFSKLVSKLEQHAVDEEKKAVAYLTAHETAAVKSVKAFNIAQNVRKLLGE